MPAIPVIRTLPQMTGRGFTARVEDAVVVARLLTERRENEAKAMLKA